MAKHKAKQRKTKAIAKAEQANQAAVKTYTGGGYYFGGGYTQPDIRADEYGAAQAYTFNVAVSAAIEFWELWLDGITWSIKEESSKKILVRSDMRRFPKSGYGSRFANAVDFHEQGLKHSLWKSIAFSDMMYGETYVRYVRNDFHMPQLLEWLNPLAVEPDVIMGYIRNYRYSAAEGYETLSPRDVAYRIAKRDANNDLRGQSRVLAAIDALNLEAQQKRAFKSYFKNNMQLGGVISPREATTSLSPNQIMKMEDDLARNNKGAANAGKWVIAPTDMNITPFAITDAEKNYAIIQPLRDEILMAMGVYPQLVGDPSNANYDNTDDMKRQWWETRGIPYAKEIEGYVNKLILPTLEPNTPVFFEWDFTPYEVEKPEVVGADFSAGFIDMYKAATLRGYDGDPDFTDIYRAGDTYISKKVILQVANQIPSQYRLDMAQANEANAQAEAVITTPPTPVQPSGGIAKPIPPTEAAALMGINNITDGKKSVDELPTLADGTPIVEPPFPAPYGSIHDGIPDDVHVSHGLNHSHDLLPNVIDYSDIDPLEELKAWRRFLTNGKSAKRPFEAKALRGDLADAIQLAVDSQDKQTLLDAFRHAQERIETRVKAIQATRLDFENSVADIMSLALASNNYGRQQWSSAMRKIIRSACTRAYVDGLVNGGVLDGKLSEDDQDTLASHIATQSQYVTNLGEEIFKTEAGISEAMADRKPTLWFNKSVMPMFDAGQLSANGNRMMEFAGDDGEENCPTCKRLKGQRHRHKDWARKGLRPDAVEDSDNFDCGLWECKHHLIPVSAGERGNYLN
jgi:hypothetical protein